MKNGKLIATYEVLDCREDPVDCYRLGIVANQECAVMIKWRRVEDDKFSAETLMQLKRCEMRQMLDGLEEYIADIEARHSCVAFQLMHEVNDNGNGV